MLASHLDGLFSSEANGWHAPVTKALKDVSLELAVWRPSGDLYSIWDVVNHMAQEQFFVIHCLEGRAGWPEPFRPPGHNGHPNWPAPQAELGAEGWRMAVNRLLEGHKTLVERIRRASPEQLAAPPREGARHCTSSSRGSSGITATTADRSSSCAASAATGRRFIPANGRRKTPGAGG